MNKIQKKIFLPCYIIKGLIHSCRVIHWYSDPMRSDIAGITGKALTIEIGNRAEKTIS